MDTCKKVVSSLMIGISIAAFVGGFYGWILLGSNADDVTETGILFMTAKIWMTGISVAGFFSLASYVALSLSGRFDVSIKKEQG